MTKEAVLVFSKISALYSTEHNKLEFDPAEYEWRIGEAVFCKLTEQEVNEREVELMGIKCYIEQDKPNKIELWKRVGRMIG